MITERKVDITEWCYEFPFWFSVPGEDVSFECLLKGQGDALQRPPVGIQSPSAIKLIRYKVAPQQSVWMGEESSMDKRVQEGISVVRWAGELLPPARVGMVGVCLPAGNALPGQCPGSAVLVSLSLSPVYLGIIHS